MSLFSSVFIKFSLFSPLMQWHRLVIMMIGLMHHSYTAKLFLLAKFKLTNHFSSPLIVLLGWACCETLFSCSAELTFTFNESNIIIVMHSAGVELFYMVVLCFINTVDFLFCYHYFFGALCRYHGLYKTFTSQRCTKLKFIFEESLAPKPH